MGSSGYSWFYFSDDHNYYLCRLSTLSQMAFEENSGIID